MGKDKCKFYKDKLDTANNITEIKNIMKEVFNDREFDDMDRNYFIYEIAIPEINKYVSEPIPVYNKETDETGFEILLRGRY